jgi:hypothetical protein
LLLITVAVTVFAFAWVIRPGAMRWWSGALVLLVAISPAAYTFVTLSGSIARVAGLFTLVAIVLTAMTVVRRYEMPPVGK